MSAAVTESVKNEDVLVGDDSDAQACELKVGVSFWIYMYGISCLV